MRILDILPDVRYYTWHIGCLAQLVEQWTVNPCVAGSKPAAADNILAGFQKSEFPLLYSQVIITSYNSEFSTLRFVLVENSGVFLQNYAFI